MEITFNKKATKQDYMNLPEGAPYQLINGELIMAPTPKAHHQRIIGSLLAVVGLYQCIDGEGDQQLES